MLPIFSKPLEVVTASDVNELVVNAWPESYDVEFKKTMPHKSGGTHPWLSGGTEIGPYTRDEILSEVVALANSQGGTLVLGIEETRAKPPRAHAVSPLPRVGDLARSFEDQARSCIDPPLPLLQIRPVDTAGANRGVVIFRTPPSRNAPHRLSSTRECYTRHGTSTQKMTMREIQETTLNVARGLARVDETFKRRREAFASWGGLRHTIAAFRVTAVPVTALPDPGRIVGRRDALLDYLDFNATLDGTGTRLQFTIDGLRERAILRGVSRTIEWQGGSFRHDIYQDGVNDIWIGGKPASLPNAAPQLEIFHGHVMWAVLTALRFLTRFRSIAGAPSAEYALEIEISRFPSIGVERVVYVSLIGSFGSNRHLIDATALPALLPRIPIGLPDQFHGLLQLIHTDICDAFGLGAGTPSRLAVAFNT